MHDSSGAYSLQPVPNPMCLGDRRHGEGNRMHVRTRVLISSTTLIYPLGAAFICPNLPPGPQQFHPSFSQRVVLAVKAFMAKEARRHQPSSMGEPGRNRGACKRTTHSLSDCCLSFIEACCCSVALCSSLLRNSE